MRLLLDTNVLLWAVREPAKLGRSTRAAVADPANTVFVSAASPWEIAIKRATGKLIIEGAVRDWIGQIDFRELPITIEHGTAAGALPFHHRDPFDRMLVAQAQLESLTLVTHDAGLRRYDVAVLDARL